MTAKTRAQIQAEVLASITSNNAGQITGAALRAAIIDLTDSVPASASNWASGTAYAINDLATYQGTTYIALSPTTNDPPPSANWRVFAAAGTVSPAAQAILDAATAQNASVLARFIGSAASDPTLDGAGHTLTAGALYFNTGTNKLRTYSGTTWADYDASAQTAATNAATSATNAAGSATSASASASSAAGSASAVAGAGRIYATTTAGLAATTSGQYFCIPQAAPNASVLDLYLNSSGTAVYQNSFPSTAAFANLSALNDYVALGAPIKPTAPAGYAYVWADQDGRVVAGINDAGEFVTAVSKPVVFQVGTGNMVKYTPYGYSWALMDADGRAAVALTDAGVFTTKSLQATTLNGVPVSTILNPSAGGTISLGAQNFEADIIHMLSYGQSLSIGVAAQNAISTAQRFDNLMFNGGTTPQYATGSPLSSLVPLVEANSTSSQSEPLGETPLSGATELVKELIASENRVTYSQQSYQFLGSAPGEGATPIANLVKGQSVYTRLINQVTAGLNLANAAGKSYKVPAFFWEQGQSDGGNATYQTQLVQLQSDISTDIKALTGQPEDVLCITAQIDGGLPCLAQLAAHLANPKIRIACPTYWLEKVPAGVHFTAQSSKWFGAYCGLVYKRMVVDGGTWEPLRPVSTFRQGKIIDVKFLVQGTGLVFDQSMVSPQTNFGFYLTDPTNNPITISSVTITKRDTVRIVAAATIPTGAKLRYGFTDSSSVSGLGNLRDNAGDTLIFDGGGLNLPMHNWCVKFEDTI